MKSFATSRALPGSSIRSSLNAHSMNKPSNRHHIAALEAKTVKSTLDLTRSKRALSFAYCHQRENKIGETVKTKSRKLDCACKTGFKSARSEAKSMSKTDLSSRCWSLLQSQSMALFETRGQPRSP